ncbi:hypothetical protein [Methylobacterium sp. WL6]|uniref:hypothetical protein n=1 Tax=Methylobacterium sp. WL6 TaxID=2603901 RepID=UPI0011C89481|nr:hypothetical protein [Methylobacterium sp. WL6]TXN70468.1 hypothetical protein FV230_10455 [Methylobacterium sp. WL6]
MEANGFFMSSQAYPGDRLGLLGSPDDVDAERVTPVLFRVATPEQARDYAGSWCGHKVPSIENRLVPFARTGGDGSHAAFWLDDTGNRHIVHLGSEGQACLLGRTPLDFLRLLAIGYEELSGDCLDVPKKPPRVSGRNAAYRAWLTHRYAITIPDNAAEILGQPPAVLAETSNDPFWRWVREMQGD